MDEFCGIGSECCTKLVFHVAVMFGWRDKDIVVVGEMTTGVVVVGVETGAVTTKGATEGDGGRGVIDLVSGGTTEVVTLWN